MKEKSVLLGILGGLGPMSTFYFCELITSHTDAKTDADHVDMLISSHATTPDRTAFILDQTKPDPLPVMIRDAKMLETAGVDLIVIPCNTAHYFYDGLRRELHTPMLNIIEETVKHLKRLGVRRFGLLATDGTVGSGAYHRVCSTYGLECIIPTPEEQQTVSSIIYDDIKQNKKVDPKKLDSVVRSLCARGSERIVLGCTELSLLKKEGFDPNLYTDALEVLAFHTILACNKRPVGFSAEFEADTEEI